MPEHMMNSTDINLPQHPLTRLLHYTFLIPFFPCIRPLMNDFSRFALGIYMIGFLLVLALIIYGNRHPLARIQNDRLVLYLNYNRRAEFLRWKEIIGYKKLSPVSIRLFSEKKPHIEIRLSKSDINTLIIKLQSENILEN